MKMIFRSTQAILLACVASFGLGSSSAEAATIMGDYGFAAFGVTTDTGNITTATTFTMTPLIGGGGSNQFALVPPFVVPGSVTLNVPLATMSFSQSTWGSFAATSVVSSSFSPGVRNIILLGTYTPTVGSIPYLNGIQTAGPASITLAFTQNGGPNSFVTMSATLSSPPNFATVPEPASMTLLGMGAIGMAFGAYRRRRSQKQTAA